MIMPHKNETIAKRFWFTLEQSGTWRFKRKKKQQVFLNFIELLTIGVLAKT